MSRGKWTFLWNVKENYVSTRLIKYHWWLENPYGVSMGKGKGGKDELYKGSGIFYFNQRKFGKFVIKNRSNVWGKHAHNIVPCTMEPCLKHPPPPRKKKNATSHDIICLVITATLYWPKQKLSQPFLSNPQPFRMATSLIHPNFHGLLVTGLMGFHCYICVP